MKELIITLAVGIFTSTMVYGNSLPPVVDSAITTGETSI